MVKKCPECGQVMSQQLLKDRRVYRCYNCGICREEVFLSYRANKSRRGAPY